MDNLGEGLGIKKEYPFNILKQSVGELNPRSH
ncbi:MAG: hypothetical protein ACJAYY_003179 [Paraglaciecola sp.]|jgi:hypothetical protein